MVVSVLHEAYLALGPVGLGLAVPFRLMYHIILSA